MSTRKFTVLDGPVLGSYAFKSPNALHPGDFVIMRYPDGSTKEFTISKSSMPNGCYKCPLGYIKQGRAIGCCSMYRITGSGYYNLACTINAPYHGGAGYLIWTPAEEILESL